MALPLEELRRSPLYSEELGIELSRRDDREDFKWFLASVLFGARISESIAEHTYRAFECYGLLDPDPLPLVVEMAEALGIELEDYDRKSEDFARIEAGLLRKRWQR